ncbi:hypothetical protein GCM10028895_07480 [Pontibacter rugosus]
MGFSGAIRKADGEPAEGDVVEVYSSKREFLAMGHYAPGSIAVRIFLLSKWSLIMLLEAEGAESL